MSQNNVRLDPELCRKILLRLEAVLTSDGYNGPSNYEFEGFSPEMVAFNVRYLHDIKLAFASIPPYRDGRNGLGCWPAMLRERGMDVLDAIRDEKVWREINEKAKAEGEKSELEIIERILS